MMVNFTDLTAGLLVLHLFTFDRSWLSSPKPAGECIFYDGHCALCHGIVRFVLKRDQSKQPFCFAPLQGNFAQRTIPEQVRASLPDSVVVFDNSKKVLVRSDAVIYILKRLGGPWFVAAILFKLAPRPLRDLAYKAVAATRKQVFGTTQQMCPLVPAQWRGRFHD
jgi:predicted DCC family thiol-disulfide oxidoreductase YuxK